MGVQAVLPLPVDLEGLVEVAILVEVAVEAAVVAPNSSTLNPVPCFSSAQDSLDLHSHAQEGCDGFSRKKRNGQSLSLTKKLEGGS